MKAVKSEGGEVIVPVMTSVPLRVLLDGKKVEPPEVIGPPVGIVWLPVSVPVKVVRLVNVVELLDTMLVETIVVVSLGVVDGPVVVELLAVNVGLVFVVGLVVGPVAVEFPVGPVFVGSFVGDVVSEVRGLFRGKTDGSARRGSPLEAVGIAQPTPLEPIS